MPKKGGKKKSKDKTGKKPHRNKLTSKKYALYTIEGNSIKRTANCPRCGPGVFLSRNQNRLHCGKCHYTEFIRK